MKNRHIGFLYAAAAVLLCGSILSCGADAKTKDSSDPSGTSAGTDTQTAEPAETTLTDAVPELDFGGTSLRTIQQEQATYYFYTDTENGEPVNDVIFQRNRHTEERFNVVIEESTVDVYSTVSSLVRNAVTAGEDAYDLVLSQIFKSGSDAAAGYFYDWYELPYIDLSMPWYTKSINEAAVGDKLFMVESDLSLSYTQQTWMMLYNATKASALDLPDFYEMVDNGTWTIDKLYEYSSTAYSDVNGDGTQDDGDFYGFAATPGGCLLTGYLYAGEGRLVEVSDDLALSYPIAEEHSIDVLTKISRLFFDNPGAIKKTDALRGTRMSLFPKGNILFEAMQAGDLILDDMRQMDDMFGVLPMPKYDESQSEYYTVVDGGADIMTIPITVTQTEMIGAVVEAMSAESWQNVTGTYIDLALEQKGTRDERSVTMLRSILDSRIIDFGYLYDSGSGYALKLETLVKNADQLKSSIDKNMKAVNKFYEGVLDTLTSSEN